MSLVAFFVLRPVATILLTVGVALAGVAAFILLPIAPMPQIEQPTITVQANMSGASAQTMANSVATPLERHLGQIADVTSMSSSSNTGGTSITLQFGLDRHPDDAARDVQAAINAARVDLPAALNGNPTFRQVNPTDHWILMLSLNSQTMTAGQIFQAASTVIQQRLSQVPGVGQVGVTGSSLPAVRIELNPYCLFRYGISPETVRTALGDATSATPQGAIETAAQRYQLHLTLPPATAAAYARLVIAHRNGAAVHLGDVATVRDGVEDLYNMAIADGQEGVLVFINRQPGANVIATVERIKRLLPGLRAALPAAITMRICDDPTKVIHSSVREVETSLLIAILLVVGVVFLFLGDPRSAIIPCVVVLISLLGTFAAMLLLGYSLDYLSLMALTVVTGFVVDDAIVVLENIRRHMETGMAAQRAALTGAAEVGFTVVAMSCALIAVFIPILLMEGILGRIFREFAITLAVAVLISLVISMTAVPMLCAQLLRTPQAARTPKAIRVGLALVDSSRRLYAVLVKVALRQPLLVLVGLIATAGLNAYLYTITSRCFFPQEDTGMMVGGIFADPSTSFQLAQTKVRQFTALIMQDPAVESEAGFTGGAGCFLFVQLKPLSVRKTPIGEVIRRLGERMHHIVGANAWFGASQDINVGGGPQRQSYQYELLADDFEDLRRWSPRLAKALARLPELADVQGDMGEPGLETELTIDRDAASRLGLQQDRIDNTLYDCFGQRRVATIFEEQHQIPVVMEVDPRFWHSPAALQDILISHPAPSPVARPPGPEGSLHAAADAPGAVVPPPPAIRSLAPGAAAPSGDGVETMIPLAEISHYAPSSAPLGVSHQGAFAASGISFNLAKDVPLSDAIRAIEQTVGLMGLPPTIHGGFEGTANAYQSSLNTDALLLIAAMLCVYTILGILYESLLHPLTILSTLPSAGLGVFAALLACHLEFSNIAMIGVVLLIGIVMKNAIMVVDVAIDLRRRQQLTPEAAALEACLRRYRPILMTTAVAMLGALPLVLGTGEGSELRRPLGISIIGGMAISQLISLFTTPVVYLVLERGAQRMAALRAAEGEFASSWHLYRRRSRTAPADPPARQVLSDTR